MSDYPSKEEGNISNITFSLPPAGSLLVFFSKSKTGIYSHSSFLRNMIPLPTSSQMSVTRDSDNVLMIDFCDIMLGNETFKDLYVSGAADRVFKYYGFNNGDPWNTSVQYKTNIVDRDTFGVKSGFTATYHFIIKGNFDYSSIKAVVERPYLWIVAINGIEIKPEEGRWWLDHSLGVFNIGKLAKGGDNKLTVKTSPMKINAEVAPVYILGDFSVKSVSKGWEIQSPVRSYVTGSWLTQGLPFYSWGMKYTKEFTIDKNAGKYEIALNEWKGTVAEVDVNGDSSGVIAFPPYHLDVTNNIKQGINKIDIKIIGSLRNLLGPHHNNPPVGLASPGNWRNVKSYPAGNYYSLYNYGMMMDFVLLNGK
jgi:hypothetical protein